MPQNARCIANLVANLNRPNIVAEMMAPRKSAPKKPPATVKRGRRSRQEKNAGRWRLSIRELHVKKGDYEWTTYVVQGFKNEAGKWARQRFKTRAAAEAFVATKSLEQVTRSDGLQPVLTPLTTKQVREAEVAFSRLADLENLTEGSIITAVEQYVAQLRDRLAIERVSMRDARNNCLRDKEARGVLRHRSVIQLESSLKAFERWLCRQPRYTAQSIDEDWTPDVCEITKEDVAAYLESMRNKQGLHATPKTRNNARADLRSFFNWCVGKEDDRPLPGVSRRWHSTNPAAAVPKQLEKDSVPVVLSLQEGASLMKYVEEFKGGKLVPYFALALFAGLRPGPDGELRKLHAHANRDTACRDAGGRPLIDLARGILTITSDIAKTRRKRVVTIQPNLRKWLVSYGTEILPSGYDRDIKAVRKKMKLGHDVLRHSFISYHVAAFRSKAETALQAGNSEAIIDMHYLNLPTEREGKAFFSINPAAGERKVVPLPSAKGA